MRKKNDNREEIEAWLKNNNLKRLKDGRARNATMNGSICAGGFSSSGMAQTCARSNWIKDKKLAKGKLGQRNKKRKNRAKRHGERIIAKRKLSTAKRNYRKRIETFKARKLHEHLDQAMIRAIEKEI